MSNKSNMKLTGSILLFFAVAGIGYLYFIISQAMENFDLTLKGGQLDFDDQIVTPKIYAWLGSFGDFVGGVANPIFAFLTFLGLLFTIYMQRKELGYTVEELRRSASAFEQQNFDNTFFNMLNLLADTVSNTSVRISNGSHVGGRNSLFTLYDWLQDINPDLEIKNKLHNNNVHIQPFLDKYALELSSELISCEYESAKINNFFDGASNELNHYFRTIYNILKLIEDEENEYQKNNRPDDFDHLKYARLLRANLSEPELSLLFYNCLNSKGKNLKEVAERYTLFNNLGDKSLIRNKTVTQFSKSAFGDNPEIIAIYDYEIANGKKEEAPYKEPIADT